MQASIRLVLAVFLIGIVANQADAELQVAKIFADHMVLQRDQPIHIWGWTEGGDTVTVTFAEKTKQSTADKGGKWSATFEPFGANNQGRILRIECGDESIEIKDILVGDVWHASGQSNMAMTVGAMSRELEAVKDDIVAADLPEIRFCRVNEPESPEPLTDLRQPVNWAVCNSKTVLQFSGVAFYFARRLHTELNVPIGVIDTARGGTPIEPFIPRSAFVSHPTLKRELELGDQEDLEGIWKLPGGVRARDANWLPGRLFHSRLAPISRFPVRGTIWYQGESNSGVQEDPRDYQHKMRALINGWRQEFGDKTMPVYYVQLPGSGAGDGWPYLREQQRLATDLSHTGMVVTIDIDGEGIHPPNKIDIGHRLARWALTKNYGKRITFSGPMFDRQEIRDNKISIHFRHAEGGLMMAEKDGLSEPVELTNQELANFEITDKSGEWQPATATIDDETVIVTHPDISSPIAVRYAYAVSPDNCNLYNRAGLPASPFCSQPGLLTYDPKLPE